MEIWKYLLKKNPRFRPEHKGHYFEILDSAAENALNFDGRPQIFYGKVSKIRRNYVVFQPSAWIEVVPTDFFSSHSRPKRAASFTFLEPVKTLRKRLRARRKTRMAVSDMKDVLPINQIDFPEEYHMTEGQLP